MTETQWLECPYSLKMLDFLRGRARTRKLRFFTAACCRRVEPLLTVERLEACRALAASFDPGSVPARFRAASSLESVDALERLADDQFNCSTLKREADDAFKVADLAESAVSDTATPAVRATRKAVEAVYAAIESDGLDVSTAAMLVAEAAVAERGDNPAERPAVLRSEAAWQAALLRDLFGNPFRPPPFDVQWRSATVVNLARTLYEDRAFERLPVLGSALMDAGCADETVLEHCRRPGPHVRGCWVVDWVLQR